MGAGTRVPRVPLRAVALPSEHGAWGLTVEPVLLGVLVAPGVAGFALGSGAMLAFLARHPLNLVLNDARRGRRHPRTRLAAAVAAAYGGAAATALLLAVLTARGAFWWPLAVAAPLIAYQLWRDARREGRGLISELSGAVAVASAAPAIALAAGWGHGEALGLWLVLAARVAASVPLVRVQVRRARGVEAASTGARAAGATAVAAVGLAAALGAAPWLAALAVTLLAAAGWLSLAWPPGSVRAVGWQQVASGLALVALTALGYRLDA